MEAIPPARGGRCRDWACKFRHGVNVMRWQNMMRVVAAFTVRGVRVRALQYLSVSPVAHLSSVFCHTIHLPPQQYAMRATISSNRVCAAKTIKRSEEMWEFWFVCVCGHLWCTLLKHSTRIKRWVVCERSSPHRSSICDDGFMFAKHCACGVVDVGDLKTS